MSEEGAPGTFGQGEGTLTRAAELVREQEQKFIKDANTLSDQINNLKGKWGGEGAMAFQQLHVAWDEKHRTIVAALNAFAESLGMTERINIEADQQQADKARMIASRLDG